MVYKIKHLGTGQYSTGGYHPQFTRNGKTWTSKRALNCHLSMLGEDVYEVYHHCKLVPFKEDPSRALKVEDYLQDKSQL